MQLQATGFPYRIVFFLHNESLYASKILVSSLQNSCLLDGSFTGVYFLLFGLHAAVLVSETTKSTLLKAPWFFPRHEPGYP